MNFAVVWSAAFSRRFQKSLSLSHGRRRSYMALLTISRLTAVKLLRSVLLIPHNNEGKMALSSKCNLRLSRAVRCLTCGAMQFQAFRASRARYLRASLTTLLPGAAS